MEVSERLVGTEEISHEDWSIVASLQEDVQAGHPITQIDARIRDLQQGFFRNGPLNPKNDLSEKTVELFKEVYNRTGNEEDFWVSLVNKVKELGFQKVPLTIELAIE